MSLSPIPLSDYQKATITEELLKKSADTNDIEAFIHHIEHNVNWLISDSADAKGFRLKSEIMKSDDPARIKAQKVYDLASKLRKELDAPLGDLALGYYKQFKSISFQLEGLENNLHPLISKKRKKGGHGIEHYRATAAGIIKYFFERYFNGIIDISSQDDTPYSNIVRAILNPDDPESGPSPKRTIQAAFELQNRIEDPRYY